MSSPSNVIDLPISPLRSTVAEGNLLNAPVAATLMNGKTITGRLLSLDGPQAVLILHGGDKGRSVIKFSELRQLNFISKHPTNTGKHPLEQQAEGVSMPRAVEDFHVIFTDGRFLTGRTRGSFVDETGLHFFQLVGSAHISRIFIPAHVVRKYNIGDRKHESLQKQVEHRPVENPAPDHRPASKRRKSDRGTNGMAVNSTQLEEMFGQANGREKNDLLESKQIGAMLVDDKVITAEQLDAALKVQQQDRSKKIGEILVKMGTVEAHDVYRTLAHKFGLPFVLLRNFYIDIECLSLVPADVAQKYSLIPLVIYQNRLVVAMDDPTNTEAVTLLRFITHYGIEPTIATRDDIHWAIGKYYGTAKTGVAASPPTKGFGLTLAPLDAPITAPRGVDMPLPEKAAVNGADNAPPPVLEKEGADSKPIISFVDNTVIDAIQRNAVDIHMVPKRDYVELQFRIDGSLIPIRRFSKVLMPQVLQRLRAMGGMDVNGKGAQTGTASIVSDGAVFGLRMTLTPGADGELVCIHLIDTGERLKGVKNLGLSTREEFVLSEALDKTYSMILVTGPENSDKSATLYAALLALKGQNLRILTVEDPVAHHLIGIDQVQIDRRAGESYSGCLGRLNLRNADVIVLGELNDHATADAAIEAALGEHLVLSKLHANNSVDALIALVDMGIEPRRLKAALPCILAQHALRLNCSHCLQVDEVQPSVRQALGIGPDEVFYRGTGCTRCNGTGFQGRTIVYELMELTPDIYALLEKGAPASDIRQQVIRNGMVPVMENALRQARTRAVSLSEVYRHG